MNAEQPQFAFARWENDEFVITYGGTPLGKTLCRPDRDMILQWLKSAQSELFDMNTQSPLPKRKAVARKLDYIKSLRHEHSNRFMAGDFQSMSTVTEKIKLAWENYEFAARCAHEKRVCFNCCGVPQDEFSVGTPGNLYIMRFCSAECRMEFGVSLGLT